MSTIAVIAPASTMASMPDDMRVIGLERLQRLGFAVRLGRNVDRCTYHTSGTVDERAADIVEACVSPDVDLVMAAFGGYNSNQLLDHLDLRAIAKSGKAFIGFSDVTALLLPLASAGCMRVLHGPSFSSFCDPGMPDYTQRGFLSVWEGRSVTYRSPKLCASDRWWLKDAYGPREWVDCDGWMAVSPGQAQGRIYGGNLEAICALVGTAYLPNFRNCIVFLEDASGSSPGAFHRDLTHLRQAGALTGIRGLLLGRPPSGSALAEAGCVEYVLQDVLEGELDIPVVANVNCSHVDPIMTIPLGGWAEIAAPGRDPPEVRIRPWTGGSDDRIEATVVG